MKSRLLFSLLLLLFIPWMCGTVSGQRFESIKQAEDTLVAVLASLNRAENDSVKQALNRVFAENMLELIKLPAADSYPFDSLRSLGKITSPDHKFRIFHWNLPTDEGRHHYFGFIKILGHNPPLVYPLADRSDSIDLPDTAILGCKQWYGALYYKVIPGETASGEKIYTLLGWAGKNPQVTRKVIEVLRFNDQDLPYFGMKLFPDFHDGKMTRIIFSFAATTTMSLKYEKQPVASNKTWNSKKRVFDYSVEDVPMIVFDRLVPLDPKLEGNYQFYVPDGAIFDGFIFRNHMWVYQGNIESKK
ncbi:MAG: hypothetical protein WCJ26_00885 [bacterium]